MLFSSKSDAEIKASYGPILEYLCFLSRLLYFFCKKTLLDLLL